MREKFNFPLVNAKAIGKIKDETFGHAFVLFAGMQAKVYCKEMEIFTSLIQECKSKGVDRHKINELTVDDYLNVLHTKNPLIAKIRRIETKIASVKTVSVQKIAIRFGDDKRFQIPNTFSTLAHGNCNINSYNSDGIDTELTII